MSHSFTSTESFSFTRAHARLPASKVAADLKRMQRYYGSPSNHSIELYEEELVEYLFCDYLNSVEYGFKTPEGVRVVSLFYQSDRNGSLVDGNPGGVPVGVDVSGCSFFSFLRQNWRWSQASSAEKSEFRQQFVLERSSGEAPRDGHGYWEEDRSYAHTGHGVRRKVYRPF